MKINNTKIEMFYEIKQLKEEKSYYRAMAATFLAVIIIIVLLMPLYSKPCQKIVEENHFNNKYLFCEYYGGVYSSHGNDECYFGKYPEDIYAEIKIKNGEWEFKNPKEVLEYFAFSSSEEEQ